MFPGVELSDEYHRHRISTNQMGHTTSDEAKKRMSKAKLGYHHSDESREKMRSFRNTPEYRQAASQRTKNHYATLTDEERKKSPEARETHLKAMAKYKGDNNPSRRPGASEKISQGKKNAFAKNPESLERVLNRCTDLKRFHNYNRPDLGHRCRSSWEANFARILNFLSLSYEYEKKHFILRDKDNNVVTNYTPDFYLPSRDLIIEVRGDHQIEYAFDNIQMFKDQYSNLKFLVIRDREYKFLTRLYSSYIPSWE